MNRLETMHVLHGAITTLDDAQLSELYAYAVHMTKREEPSVSPSEMNTLAQGFVSGVLGMFVQDGEKQATPPKRLAKKRTRKVKA